MAEERDGGEATEAATPKRRDDARQKGDRLVARELATAMVGVAGALWVMLFAAGLADSVRHMSAGLFGFSRADLAEGNLPVVLVSALRATLLPVLALLAFVIAGVVVGQALSGGIGFSLDPLKPKVERMNPLKGLGRMFGPKGWVELLKALAKAAILIGLSAWLLVGSAPTLMALSGMPLGGALAALAAVALRLLLLLMLGLALLAGADLPWQLFQWLKKLRMNRRELKDEAKGQEGNPEVRYALRARAREMMKNANRAGMADATVVITNPTHFAVALRYRPDADAAPVIVMRGRGLMADVIRELAGERDVMILSYPSVARALYFTGRVGAMIRPDLYAAVATIIAFVLRVEAEHLADAEPPEAEAPPGARFDADGRPERTA